MSGYDLAAGVAVGEIDWLNRAERTSKSLGSRRPPRFRHIDHGHPSLSQRQYQHRVPRIPTLARCDKDANSSTNSHIKHIFDIPRIYNNLSDQNATLRIQSPQRMLTSELFSTF